MKRERDEGEKYAEEEEDQKIKEEQEHGPAHMSRMEPVTHGAYGGGMYGTEKVEEEKVGKKVPASESQSADGPEGTPTKPKHRPPPSSGDRDIDITGQSYIQ